MLCWVLSAEELGSSKCFTRTFPICAFCSWEEETKQNEHISSMQFLHAVSFSVQFHCIPLIPYAPWGVRQRTPLPPLLFFPTNIEERSHLKRENKTSCSSYFHPAPPCSPSSGTQCLYSQDCTELSHGKTTHTHSQTQRSPRSSTAPVGRMAPALWQPPAPNGLCLSACRSTVQKGTNLTSTAALTEGWRERSDGEAESRQMLSWHSKLISSI